MGWGRSLRDGKKRKDYYEVRMIIMGWKRSLRVSTAPCNATLPPRPRAGVQWRLPATPRSPQPPSRLLRSHPIPSPSRPVPVRPGWRRMADAPSPLTMAAVSALLRKRQNKGAEVTSAESALAPEVLSSGVENVSEIPPADWRKWRQKESAGSGADRGERRKWRERE